jgi:hypothetical protein
MEIAGRVATTDVLTIGDRVPRVKTVVQDLGERTVVQDPTIGVQGRKADRDQQVRTVVHVLTIEVQGRKADRDLRERTVVQDLTIEDQGRKADRDR